MKEYLEAFDRNELPNTQEKGRWFQGKRPGGSRSCRELCSDKHTFQGYMSTHPPTHPIPLTKNLLSDRFFSAKNAEIKKLQTLSHSAEGPMNTQLCKCNKRWVQCRSREKGETNLHEGSREGFTEDYTWTGSWMYLSFYSIGICWINTMVQKK